MPYSANTFNEVIAKVLSITKPATILDIGSGAGKYGKIAKSISPGIHTTAVEIWEPYVTRYGLHDIYNVIKVMNAEALFETEINTTYDFVIFGDSIEHFRKSVGVDLIQFFIYRCCYIVIVFPIEYVQYTEQGFKYENHISVWQKSDFDGYRCIYLEKDCMALVIIQGYLSAGAAFLTLQNLIAPMR